jgi:hypothetical protein
MLNVSGAQGKRSSEREILTSAKLCAKGNREGGFEAFELVPVAELEPCLVEIKREVYLNVPCELIGMSGDIVAREISQWATQLGRNN